MQRFESMKTAVGSMAAPLEVFAGNVKNTVHGKKLQTAVVFLKKEAENKVLAVGIGPPPAL